MESRKGIGGPKTTQGKRRSSLNALKHGLYAETPQALEKVESQVGFSYREVLKKMTACFEPADAIEDLLVRRVARCAWRLLYTETMESKDIAEEGLSLGWVNYRERLMRHERLTDMQLHRAIEALNKRREAKQKSSANELIPPSVSHAQVG